MAKKDRRNRDSGLGDIIDEFSSSIDAMNSEFEQNLNAIRGEAAPPPLVDDSDEDEEDEDDGDSFSLFAGTASTLRFLAGKGFAGILLLGTAFVFLGRCSLWPLRKAASLLRTAKDNDEEEIDEADVPAASAPKPAPVSEKVDAAKMLAEYEDEDEKSLSTGHKWLFRGGVLATVMILASAGYFGYKTWSAKSELARQTTVAENGDADPKPEIIEENVPNAAVDPLLASAKAPKPKEADAAVKVAEKAPKVDVKPKTDKKVEPPVAKTETKKDDPKTVSPPAPPVKKDAPALPKIASKPVATENKDGKENGKKTETPPAAPVVAASSEKKTDEKSPIAPPAKPKSEEKSVTASKEKKPDEKPPIAPPAKPKSEEKSVTASTAKKPEEKPPVAPPAKPKPNEKPVTASTEKKSDEKPTIAPPVKPEAKPTDKAVAASPEKKPEEKPAVVAPLTVSAPKPPEKPESKPSSNDPWAQVAASADPWALPAEKSASTPASLKSDSAADPWKTNAEKTATNPPAVSTLPSLAAASPTTAAAPAPAASEPALPSLTPPPVVKAAAAPSPNAPDPLLKLPAVAAETTPPAKETAPTPQPEIAQLKPLAKKETATPINEPAPGIPLSTGTSLPKSAYESVAGNAPSTSNPSPGIPDRTSENRAVFGQMPTPPVVDTTPTDTTMIPPAREAPKAETIPSIRHTGSVRTVAGSNPEPDNRTVSEPSPGIPAARQAATTFSRPAVSSKPPENERPGIVSSEDRAPFAPPVIASSMPSVAPTATSAVPVAPAASSAPMVAMAPVPKNNEPSPTIPEERPISSAAFTTPVTPMLPQHTELAKTETPLGSRLQNGVQDLREQQEATPRIRFTSGQADSEAAAPATGAIRFNPETARTVKPTLMSVPADSNAVTELSVLLPTGTPLPEAEGTEPIPTGESAPQVMMATANPGYGRSLRNRNPAVASLDASQRTGDRESRATSFKQRLNEEIKRSPTETERYVVQDGDNYMTISDRAFGTGLLFRALAEHNRRQLGIDYRLQPGTVIEIPPANFLQTNYNDLYQRGRRRSGNRPSTSTGTSSSSSTLQPVRQGIRYIVQEGDTVFNLATNRLKDTPKWREIMALNADTIADPRDPLPAGTEILLPVQTARTGSVQR